MSEQVHREEVRPRVVRVTLDNPPVNTLSERVSERLASVVAELAERDDVVAVVFAGEGRAFCAGAEISQLEHFMEPGGAESRDKALQGLMDAIERLPQLTIAAIDGAAVGGGLELALACDLRLAGRSSKLGLPEIRLGLIPGAGGTQRLSARIGKSAALLMIAEGQVLPVRDAPQGLVDEVVDDGEALAVALDRAERLAEGPSQALRAVKRAVLAAGTRAGYDVELDEFCRVALTEDAREGVTAFMEDRSPDFHP